MTDVMTLSQLIQIMTPGQMKQIRLDFGANFATRLNSKERKIQQCKKIEKCLILVLSKNTKKCSLSLIL